MKGLPRSNYWLAVWWIVWVAVLSQQFYFAIRLAISTSNGSGSGFNRITLLLLYCPVILSSLIRWLVCTRMNSSVAAFIFFVVGIVLAAMSGLATLFLKVPYQYALFGVCFFAIAQYAPLRPSLVVLRYDENKPA